MFHMQSVSANAECKFRVPYNVTNLYW